MISMMHHRLIPALAVVLLSAIPATAENLFKPDFRVRPDDYTVVIYQEGTVSPASVEVFKKAHRLWHERKP